METKRDLLRKGDVVELEPGLKGRLDFKNKSLQLSNGTTLPISDANKRELFPENEEQKKYGREKEKIRSEIENAPIGGKFLHQMSQSGVLGGAKNWYQKLTSTADEYIRRKNAEREVSEEISQTNPYLSMAGTAASFVPDLAVTSGMSALKAAPILTAASAGPRIIEEPGQVAAETALAAGGGFILDKAAGYLGKVASRRKQIREFPSQLEAASRENIQGSQDVAQRNLQQKQNFFEAQNKIKSQNDSLLKQYEDDLIIRKNKMIDAKNSYEKAKIDRQTAIGQDRALVKQQETLLNDQYNAAKREYEDTLKNIPQLQKKAQQEYSNNVVKNAESIQKVFPKNSKIPVSQIGVEDFINDSINKTGLGASREANQASKIIKSIFPEGEIITANDLSGRYRAIENAIQKSTPEVKSILSDFKNHLGEQLPTILQDNIAYSKVIPLLKRYLEKDVISTLEKVPKLDRRTIAAIKFNATRTIRNVNPENFVNRMGNGDIARQIVEEMAPIESFLTFLSKSDIELLKSGKLGKKLKGAQGVSDYLSSVLKTAQEKRQAFIDGLTFQLNQRMGNYEIKAMEAANQTKKKLGIPLKETRGISPDIEIPSPPKPPEAILPPLPPPEIPLPPELPVPSKPNLQPSLNPPVPDVFIPNPEPTLSPAQGIAEKLGDYLERPKSPGDKGLTGLLKSPMAKLGMLKYLTGSAAPVIESGALAGYGGLQGLKALTAPGAEVARKSFKQLGVAAIEEMAQQYPSYVNGILQDPMERRSLTKEIEEDPEIPPAQKALYQSKVNRGLRLNDRIQ